MAAARCIDEEHGYTPQRHELVEAYSQTVVCGALLAATGTNRLGPLPFSQRHVDMKGRAPPDEFCPMENKTGLPLDSIQDSLQLHRVDGVCVVTAMLTRCALPAVLALNEASFNRS